MNFISVEFLVFLPLVVLLYWSFAQRYRWVLLLAVSCLAYLYWNTWTVFIMLGMALLTFFLAKAAAGAAGGQGSRIWMWIAVAVCLSVFAGFRFVGFFPVGMSFYLFQMLSYVFDVYRGELLPERNFGWYALYISFFPQLVAGPIERPHRLLGQLHALPGFSREGIEQRCYLVLRGFFKKLVVADYLAVFVDRAYGAVCDGNGPAVVCATMLFAFQIYCDFSGYSDIAAGAACMLGIRLMDNFNHPYEAESIRDFWHRWHISLTGWFTDYVYKPLGGSRRGLACYCRNIMVVFLLSGLWHGMAWNYVLWGGIHGVYLVVETMLARVCGGMGASVRGGAAGRGRCLRRAAVFLLVCFAWIFFRAASLADALVLVKSLPFGWTVDGIGRAVQFLGLDGAAVLRIVCMICSLALLGKPSWEDSGKTSAGTPHPWVRFFAAFLLLLLVALGWLSLLAKDAENAFIYFQF